jgi:hypothetical protein
VQTGKVSKLKLQDGFRVVSFDEFGSVRTELDHVLSLLGFSLEIGHQSDAGWRALFWELEHLEHPIGNVAYALGEKI